MEIRSKTIKGVSWTVISQFSRLFINLIVMAVLARLLDPADFGLLAMITVFSNFFSIVNDLGLPSAVIQKKEVDDTELSSAFWLNLIQGVLISMVFLALSPVISRFYHRSALMPMMMVLSAAFTISSIGMIQAAILSRRLDFKTLSKAEISAVAAGGGVAVALASIGAGAWSIVALSLTQYAVLALILFVRCNWKPRLIFRWSPVRGLLGFGVPLMGFNFVNYFSRNLDNLLIGRYLGPVQLGYYDMAYKSLLFPLGNVSQVIGRVMFPALSMIQDDKARVREAYIRATQYIAVVTFPLMAGIAILAPHLVRIVLGPKWMRAVFLVQVLAGIGGLQSIYTTTGWIFLSQGRTRILFFLGVLMAAVYTTSFLIGLHWQVEGVAVAYAAAFLLMLYPYCAIPFRIIEMRFGYYVRQFLEIAGATAGAAIAMLGVVLLVSRVLSLGDVVVVVAAAPVGAVTYTALLTVMKGELLKSFLRTARAILPRNGVEKAA